MINTPLKKIIFIYNADSGLRNMIIDSAHKVVSPNTYQCSLCEITFGVFTENTIWKNFRKQSDVPMVFLHKDEFSKAYASKFSYKFTFPIVLGESEKGLEVFVKTEELNEMKKLEDLISLIKARSL